MSLLNIQKVPTTDDRTLPIFAEFDKLAKDIRVQAYNLFARRGADEGGALDDWLAAEREVCWPAAELIEDDDGFVLNVALPGFDAADISVTATPREILVKAARKQERKESENKKGTKLQWTEFRSNDVLRRIELPRDVNVDKISADLRNGLLKITAPQAQDAAKSAKKVKVTAAS
jgi:HSP20 family protein